MNQPISKPYGHNKRILTEDYSFTIPNGKKITAPRGTVYNGASFPRILYFLFQPFDPEFEPMVVLHDPIYQGKIRKFNDGTPISRKTADDIAIIILAKNNVSEWKRNIINFGIRVGGWMFFKRE